MNNEIIKNIVGINEEQVRMALDCHDVLHTFAACPHVIDVLATEAGYASGTAMVNDLNLWKSTLAEVTQILLNDLEEQNA